MASASDITFEEALYDFLYQIYGIRMENLGLDSEAENIIWGVLNKFDEQIAELEDTIKEELESVLASGGDRD
jgi:hypothetical protein